MVLLRAVLLGDVATLYFPHASSGHQSEELEGRKGLGYMLGRSFGKVAEVPSQQDSLPTVTPQQPAAMVSGLRCLQLSLEEAFYLSHVDECLALTLGRVVFPTEGANALPRQHRPGDEHPGPLDHHDHKDRSGTEEDPGGAIEGQVPGAGFRFVCSGGRDAENHRGGGSGGGEGQGEGDDDALILSDEEAWRYCCDRRPNFPAMFAVFRHFRTRRYTVQSGHKYGAHFVLYDGPPDECHSRYCVHVAGGGGGGDSWGHIKTMTRLMPDIAKCLLVCGVRYPASREQQPSSEPRRPSYSPMDTSALVALASAEVTALRFSRTREPADGGSGRSREGGGSTNAAAVLKDRAASKSASCAGKSAKITSKRPLT